MRFSFDVHNQYALPPKGGPMSLTLARLQAKADWVSLANIQSGYFAKPYNANYPKFYSSAR
jgi:hypothetical protein